jgi:chromosome segregation ATPase
MSGPGDLAISHERLVSVLERRLHAATSELAMRDAAIEELQEKIGHLEEQLASARMAGGDVASPLSTPSPA